MSERANDNRGFLKEKLGNYQVDPPASVWRSISAQSGQGRSRKRMYILLLAGAASIALALTFGLHYFSPDLESPELLVEEISVTEEPVKRQGLEERVAETMIAIEEEAQMQIAKTAEARETTETTEVPDTPDTPDRPDRPVDLPLQDFMEESPEVIRVVQNTTDSTLNPFQEGQDQEPENEEARLALAMQSIAMAEDSAMEATNPLPPHPKFVTEEGKQSTWMVGAAVSPLYSFRDAETTAMAGSANYESGLLSYSGGVYVNYRRNRRLSFETGIYYNQTGVNIGAPGIQLFAQNMNYMDFSSGVEVADVQAVTNSVGNIIAHSGDIFVNGYKLNAEVGNDSYNRITGVDNQNPEDGITQHLDYLELPFNLRYSIIDRIFELQLIGGMSTNFLVNNSVTMNTESGPTEIGYLTNIRTVNYSGNAGVGMIYHMGESFSIRLEPRFRYFLHSVNDATLPSTRPYTLGIYTGLNFTF